jgi:hypothetical protein
MYTYVAYGLGLTVYWDWDRSKYAAFPDWGVMEYNAC